MSAQATSGRERGSPRLSSTVFFNFRGTLDADGAPDGASRVTEALASRERGIG